MQVYISPEDLVKRLTPDLEVYTVVRLAKLDLGRGDINSAMARLKVDVDKIRTHDPELAQVICSFELTD